MRVPPHDNEAEQSVLGSILIDREALSIVRDVLVPEDFYAERHAVLYRAALALDDRGEAIDTVTLRDQLERGPGIGRAGGMDYIAELTLVVPSSASVKHYADIVIAHALRRRLIEAGGKGDPPRLRQHHPGQRGDRPGRAGSVQDRPGESRLGDAQHRAGGARVVGCPREAHRAQAAGHGRARPTSRSSTCSPRGCSPASCHPCRAPRSRQDIVRAQHRPQRRGARRQAAWCFSLEMSRQSLVQRLICSEAHVELIHAPHRPGRRHGVPEDRQGDGHAHPRRSLDRRLSGPCDQHASSSRAADEVAAQDRVDRHRLPPAHAGRRGAIRESRRSRTSPRA